MNLWLLSSIRLKGRPSFRVVSKVDKQMLTYIYYNEHLNVIYNICHITW